MRANPQASNANFNQFDLTLELLKDIGWRTNSANDFVFLDGFEPNPCAFVEP
jgi:hypothetical protein